MAKQGERILAHRIVLGDEVYTMSVAEAYADDSGRWNVRITPFCGESHSTSFHSGTVVILAADGSPFAGSSDNPPVFCKK